MDDLCRHISQHPADAAGALLGAGPRSGAMSLPFSRTSAEADGEGALGLWTGVET